MTHKSNVNRQFNHRLLYKLGGGLIGIVILVLAIYSYHVFSRQPECRELYLYAPKGITASTSAQVIIHTFNGKTAKCLPYQRVTACTWEGHTQRIIGTFMTDENGMAGLQLPPPGSHQRQKVSVSWDGITKDITLNIYIPASDGDLPQPGKKIFNDNINIETTTGIFYPGDSIKGTFDSRLDKNQEIKIRLERGHNQNFGMFGDSLIIAKTKGRIDADGIMHFELKVPLSAQKNEARISVYIRDNCFPAATCNVQLDTAPFHVKIMPLEGKMISGMPKDYLFQTYRASGEPLPADIRVDTDCFKTDANGLAVRNMSVGNTTLTVTAEALGHKIDFEHRFGPDTYGPALAIKLSKQILAPGEYLDYEIYGSAISGPVWLLIGQNNVIYNSASMSTTGRESKGRIKLGKELAGMMQLTVFGIVPKFPEKIISATRYFVVVPPGKEYHCGVIPADRPGISEKTAVPLYAQMELLMQNPETELLACKHSKSYNSRLKDLELSQQEYGQRLTIIFLYSLCIIATLLMLPMLGQTIRRWTGEKSRILDESCFQIANTLYYCALAAGLLNVFSLVCIFIIIPKMEFRLYNAIFLLVVYVVMFWLMWKFHRQLKKAPPDANCQCLLRAFPVQLIIFTGLAGILIYDSFCKSSELLGNAEMYFAGMILLNLCTVLPVKMFIPQEYSLEQYKLGYGLGCRSFQPWKRWVPLAFIRSSWILIYLILFLCFIKIFS